jgi:DNA polymerase elongation subunit (family B)
MKVPLIATVNHRTIDLRDGSLKVKIYKNSSTEAVTSPYVPYYMTEDDEGKEYRLIASDKKIKLSKHKYIPKKDVVPPHALYDGGRESLMERLCIEHPEFFAQYPNTDVIKTLVFDIETHSPDGSFPFGEKYPVVAIGIVTSTGEREVFLWDGKDDRDVLLKFAAYVNDYDPDIMCGYNLVGYDIPQILHRANFHGLKGYKKILNRDNTEWGWETPENQKELKMQAGGRIVLDLLRWTRLDYSLSGIPRGLKSVAKNFGLEPIELDFANNDLLDYPIEEIHDYVLSDVDATLYLYNHYFPQIQYIAETLCVPLATYINAPVSYITKILQGRSLFEQGIVTLDKNKERHPEIYRADKGNYQAAHIELYQPGFHAKNVKVDFSSFYPSIAMALNLGPDTTQIIGYEDYKEDLEFKNDILYIPDNRVGKRLMIKIDPSRKSCLYNMCAEFKEMRKPYKLGSTKEDKSKSDALKIMVNTFYGANANPYISYGDMGVGLTITAVARWLLLSGVDIIRARYGEDAVVYVHTDGINTNVDVDEKWLTNRLRLLLKHVIPDSESEHISMDKDYFKEGVWLQVGNYVLRNEDGSLTKHGSTFKATSRSQFYLKVLDRVIENRINNTITQTFIDKLYDLQEYELSDFVMRKSQGRKREDYKSETDLILTLMDQGKEIGIIPSEGTTYYYVKCKEGYKLESLVKDIDEIDIRYYWDTISTLLQKFQLKDWVRKKPPLTVLDKKQQSLMDWM